MSQDDNLVGGRPTERDNNGEDIDTDDNDNNRNEGESVGNNNSDDDDDGDDNDDNDNDDLSNSTVEYDVQEESATRAEGSPLIEENNGSDSDTQTDSSIFVKESNDDGETSDATTSDDLNHFQKSRALKKSTKSASDKKQCSTSGSEIGIVPSAKRSYDEMRSDRDDEDHMCPICLEIWTSEGSHRLCSLKCGHLFGKSCIMNWLVNQKKNCCPQCNKKAMSYEIRDLFATKLIALDYSEKTKLENEIEMVKKEKRQVEMELARCRLCMETYKMEVNKLKSEISKIMGKTDNNCTHRIIKFHLEKTLPISDGSCRVSSYNSANEVLIVCHQSNVLFTGYGVRRIVKLGTDYVSNNFQRLHMKPIRDMKFHPLTPNVILTVAFDKCAKISNLDDRNAGQTFTTEYPLWSCCWDEEEPDYYFVGNGRGTVLMLDVRSPGTCVTELKLEGDNSSVVSLAYVRSKPPQNLGGGIICCRLNSVVYYEKDGSTGFISHRFNSLVGPFFSLIFDSDTRHFVASCRPATGLPNVRHIFCELYENKCQPIHVFLGGTIQSVLSRPCFIKFNQDTLLAAFQEANSAIELWSTSSGLKVSNFHVNEEIYDLSSMVIGTRTFIAAIASSAVRFYEAS